MTIEYLLSAHKECVTATMIDTLHGGAEKLDNQCKLFKAALPAIQGDSLQAYYHHNSTFYNLVHTIANDTLHDGYGSAQSMIQLFDTLDFHRTFIHGEVNLGARKNKHTEAVEETQTQSVNGIQLIPNPTQGELTLMGINVPAVCYVYNTLQQRQLTLSLAGEKNTVLNISSLPNGIYFIVVTALDQSQSATFKIILQK
jgi:hypothetical protein